MKKTVSLIVSFFLFLMLAACATVPITGRQQLSLVSHEQMMSMSYQSYDEFMRKHRPSRDHRAVSMVRRVGTNIQHAVEQYLAQTGQSHLLKGYGWEFSVVEDDAENAFCMPGGKVVVYDGLLPIAQTDAGLAVVLGHEIAHAIANHGSERVSQQLALQFGGVAFDLALAQSGSQARQIFNAAYGLGSTVGVILPYSRLHESEADRLGLIFMAMAGYDPRESLSFWQRMAQSKGAKGGPPEFLSTHPADQTRIQNIKHNMPEALQYYNR